MIITIYRGNFSSNLMLGSTDRRFSKAWGQVFKTSSTNLFNDMVDISRWCNNELNEECLFEVEGCLVGPESRKEN